MKPETQTKLFSALKKKTYLGVLLAICAGNAYAIEEQTQPQATKAEEAVVEQKPAMITIPQEKLFEVITARAKKLASEPYVRRKS